MAERRLTQKSGEKQSKCNTKVKGSRNQPKMYIYNEKGRRKKKKYTTRINIAT